MTMTGTTTMVVTKTMIMTIVATMTKNFQTSSTRQFLLLVQNDKKGYENSICTSSLKNRFFSLLSLLNLSVEPALPPKNP